VSFIEDAIRYGYKAEEILQTMMSANPEFANKIGDAFAFGYSANEILQSLASNFQGKQGKKAAKRFGFRPDEAQNLVFSSRADPSTIIRESIMPEDQGSGLRTGLGTTASTAAGGLIGAAIGGPAGALRGAAAGYGAGGDLVKSYEKHRAEGGSMKFNDFVRAAMKGGASALAAGQAYDFFNKPPTQATGEPAGLLGGGEVIDISTGEQSSSEPIITPPPEPAAPVMERDTARSILNAAGVLGALEGAAKINPIEKVSGMARHFLGASKVEKLEKKTGLAIDDIIAAAFPQEEQAGTPIAPEQPQDPLAEADKLPPEIGASTPIAPQPETPVAPETPQVDERTQSAIMSAFDKAPVKASKGKQRAFDPVTAVPSSNIRSIHYNPKEKYLQTLFGSGQAYEYFDVPANEVEKLRAGSVAAKTEGENAFRLYYTGKDPSVGATFNEIIKKGGYDYNPIESEQVRSKNMQAVQRADRVYQAVNSVEQFDEIFEAAKTQQQLPKIKELSALADDLDPDVLEAFILETRLGYRKLSRERLKEGKTRQTATSKRVVKAIEQRYGEPKPKPKKRRKKSG